jgi:hypothetical protein
MSALTSTLNADEANGGDASPVVRCRVPEIWEDFFEQMDEIDALEKRLNEHATRARRRTASLLDQTPTHRRSHLRMFVTHKYDKDLSRWTLVVEGKLLVGHLDHKRAALVEQEGELAKAKSSGGTDVSPKDGPVRSLAISPTAAASTSTPKTEADATAKSDRSQYRSMGEREEDPIEPVLFTYIFDKLVVVFRTIYQPKKPPVSKSSFSAAKKSRSTKRKAEKQDVASVNPRHLRASEPTKLIWNKEDAPDSHAFFVNYTNDEAARPPPPEMKFHSVVATITMYSTRSETLYQPSTALAEKFFPKHKNESGRSSRSGDSKRPKSDEAVDEAPIPLDNEIAAPSLLTMDEIIHALFQYIHDKNLQDANDKSLISCDKVLSSLLDCESLSFADLQQTLLSKELVVPVEADESPIVLTYVMTEKTTSPQSPSHESSAIAEDDDDEHQNQVLSFDMDVWVPSLLHYRSRDILRRIKRREFEYTSSRTKARYLMVASRGNEDIVKTKIEQAVSGRGYAAENIPVFLALAKAAPKDSEARGSAQADAKICALLERLDECTRSADASWEVVGALNGIAG